jgi:hypothetical protein
MSVYRILIQGYNKNSKVVYQMVHHFNDLKGLEDTLLQVERRTTATRITTNIMTPSYSVEEVK